MTFIVRLFSETDPMPPIPVTALNWARRGAGIWMVKDGKAERYPVTIRFGNGGNAWVETNVPEGATIVVKEAANEAREIDTETLRDLPEDIDGPDVTRNDNDIGPIMRLALLGGYQLC